MNFSTIADQLIQLEEQEPQYIERTSKDIAQLTCNDQVKIIDLVRGLDPVLTNGSHDVRLKGVEMLVNVVISLPKGLLSEKEIEVLVEFLFLRLIDHKMMEPATLKCLSYFIECKNRPAKYNKQLIEFLKTKTTVAKMEIKTRHQVYEIIMKILSERQRFNNSMDSDLVYSIIEIIEGENNPDNLMISFSIISFILKNFNGLEPFIDDIFEWLSSYYPIDYTPQGVDRVTIQRSDLVRALYDCFYASPIIAEDLQTLLLEKVDSNVSSTRLESLNCLMRCYEVFPLSSIKNYASTFWTSIRMICLKKPGSVEPNLLETCLNTLSALAAKLSEDGDLYFNFVSDMYEELAITLRKPEMELFEPATKLLTHAILPSIVGFNYMLSKMLPVALNALNAGDLRPLTGLAYVFEQLNNSHPDSQLKTDLKENLSKLMLATVERVDSSPESLRVLNALIRAKVYLDDSTLIDLTTKLWTQLNKCPSDLEGCLALICMQYDRIDLISDSVTVNQDFGSLLSLVDDFELNLSANAGSSNDSTQFLKFSVYLRLILLRLDQIDQPSINHLNGNVFGNLLRKTRKLATEFHRDINFITKIAQIHAVVLNKLKTNSLDAILMEYFGSDYCQKLVSSNDHEKNLTSNVYLPVLGWVFKSLMMRNHLLAIPLVNLLLNFITSDKIDLDLAINGSQIFRFILTDDEDLSLFKQKGHYQRFSLYKQKFYAITNKEIKIRYEMQTNDLNRLILLCSIASQVPQLPIAAYKRDRDWLTRELLRALTILEQSIEVEEQSLAEAKEILLQIIHSCLESLIRKDSCGDLTGFLGSLVEVNLKHAQEAKTLQIRRRALICLANVASSFKEPDLLTLRPKVLDILKLCLADKKRLVRQAAAEARMKWVLIGQPIG